MTLHNARSFFTDATYTPSTPASQKPRLVKCAHRMSRSRRTVDFEVIDDARKLGRKDWDRVVAVIAQGKAWQFKVRTCGGSET